MSPLRWKVLGVELSFYPTLHFCHCLPHSSPPATSSSPHTKGPLQNSTCSPSLQPRKLSFHSGGLSSFARSPVLLKELEGNSSVLLTQVSGSMDHYSLECFTWWQFPRNTNLVLPDRDWTAIVPDEPYRVKGLCQWNLYSTTTLHIHCSPTTLIPHDSF